MIWDVTGVEGRLGSSGLDRTLRVQVPNYRILS